MSSNLATFEVEVEVVYGNKHYGYYTINSDTARKNMEPKKGVFIKDAIVKMLQFENCTRERAISLGKKHGKVKSCRKIDANDITYNEVNGIIERLNISQKTVYDRGNQYASPIAMNEMIWNKKSMRKNNFRDDKKVIDDFKS
jgi:hypothetical protein